MVEEKKHDIYGDNYLDDYPSYLDAHKFVTREKVNVSAVVYGAGLALALTFVVLVLGFLWAQAVESVDYSMLVDLGLAGSVLFGAFKGTQRARSLGLVHGALTGAAYSVTGILILAVLLPVNWLGALETVVIAVILGALGGVAGVNFYASRESAAWRSRQPKPDDRFDDYDEFLTRQ